MFRLTKIRINTFLCFILMLALMLSPSFTALISIVPDTSPQSSTN